MTSYQVFEYLFITVGVSIPVVLFLKYLFRK